MWINGVSPQMIADALAVEFRGSFSPDVVHGIAYRNDFPPAKRSLRGDAGSDTLLPDVVIRSSSESYLAALQAVCPRFDSREANR